MNTRSSTRSETGCLGRNRAYVTCSSGRCSTIELRDNWRKVQDSNLGTLSGSAGFKPAALAARLTFHETVRGPDSFNLLGISPYCFVDPQMAVGTGLEPVIPFQGHLFSKQAVYHSHNLP